MVPGTIKKTYGLNLVNRKRKAETLNTVKDTVASKSKHLPVPILSDIPDSAEFVSVSPHARALELCEAAAKATAKISGHFAMVPGPVKPSALLPDMMAMWEIQRQLVADIASVYGTTSRLGKEQMLWCLLKHSAVHTFRDVVYRAGERFFTHPLSLKVLRQLATTNGLTITQSDMSKSIASFLPIIGASAVTWYAYNDTKKIGAAAIALFARETTFDNEA